MLYHPFFVNIQKVIPPHIFKHAEQLLNPHSAKSKPSTSITDVSRNQSASVGDVVDINSPKRRMNNVSASLPKNPPVINNRSRNIQQLPTILAGPSVLKYNDSHKVFAAQSHEFRGSSLPTNISFTYTSAPIQ